MRTSLISASIAVPGLALALILTGCSGPATGSSSTQAPRASTAAVQPSASPSAAPKDVLFTISANVRDKTGSTIAIQLTAHTPRPYSSLDAKPLISEFVRSCGGGIGGTPITPESLAANGSILLPMDLASSATGKTFVYPVGLNLGSSYFGQSAIGKGIAPADATRPCYNGYSWSKSGTGHAIADFETSIPTPDPTIWKYAYYGFTLPPDSGATIEACSVTLSPQAVKTVVGVDGWDPTKAGSGIACGVGYMGE
ncbi:MAG: hypothetical protein QOI70_263 [Microbacteriaceae bacterium]|nr:hypothetical protein [Microbacteriaceae bacterium]